jgi:hypothetical protein
MELSVLTVAKPRIMEAVRRLLCSLVLASCALGLHASVPALNSAAALNHHADARFESNGRPALALTAAPADISFYYEFYSAISARQEQPKTSVLHWFGSLIKKAVRR